MRLLKGRLFEAYRKYDVDSAKRSIWEYEFSQATLLRPIYLIILLEISLFQRDFGLESGLEAAQKQLVEKERLLRDSLHEDDRLSAQQAVQEQVIEKEREVCSLQQQLADELSKRQAAPWRPDSALSEL